MIIGVTGLIGSGKSTVADLLVEEHNFKKMAFADTLKDVVSIVFSWERKLLEGDTSESREWRETVDSWWSEKLNIPSFTPRLALQLWGTEVGRAAFHDDIWILSILNKLRDTSENIVLTDCRFKNEIQIIQQLGGKVVRVTRGKKPSWYDLAVKLNTETGSEDRKWLIHLLEDVHKIHASEYSSVGFDYDHIIDNSGTLNDLRNKITQILV